MKTNFIDALSIRYNKEFGARSMKYVAEIRHPELNEYRLITASDEYILKNKVDAYLNKLREKWGKLKVKNTTIYTKETGIKQAEQRTREAKQTIQDIEETLLFTLGVDDTVNWDTLKNYTAFSVPHPQNFLAARLSSLTVPQSPKYQTVSEEPILINPPLGWFDKLIKPLGDKKMAKAQQEYEEAYLKWQSNKATIEQKNTDKLKGYKAALEVYEREVQQIHEQLGKETHEWEEQKRQYEQKQQRANGSVDQLQKDYYSKNPDAVIEYCEIVLNNSFYPDSFPRGYELEYNQDNGILVVEFTLPAVENIPTLQEVKYIATKQEFSEKHFSESQIAKLYDNTIYQVVLRTIHELFEADKADALTAVNFNGWVNTLDKAIGKRTNTCIVSIQVKKSEFLKIELQHVDPKACFKNLKGVGSSKLSGITAVQPIIKIERGDRRFVDHYDVAHTLDSSVNLAVMDWQDFEHLIREVFGKEFNSGGGEVKITQASRDGGVDAVAFDPDPIRGGKIVIQAKRYTNTVGVSAVRDLYGTLMNEGATKGILVTTTDYGPDAYEFAKGKPISLLNGANLLYLLEKHGHAARIDIREAKQRN
jgi:restriction system protein